MLVASTNPTIVYYHDGFLRVSLKSYDKKSNDVSLKFKKYIMIVEELVNFVKITNFDVFLLLLFLKFY